MGSTYAVEHMSVIVWMTIEYSSMIGLFICAENWNKFSAQAELTNHKTLIKKGSYRVYLQYEL